jgi:hypothetical protein
MAHHLVQMEKEMEVTVTAHNLKYINILINTAVTAEERSTQRLLQKRDQHSGYCRREINTAVTAEEKELQAMVLQESHADRD